MHESGRFGWPASRMVLRLAAMRLRTSSIQRRHLVPRCLDCGREQPGSEISCQGCGSDLQARPARSYAEMEGLVEFDPPEASPDPFLAWRQRITLERWLLTGFTAAVTLAFLLHAAGALWD